MKKLSDYQGDDAIELWGHLMPPILRIIQNGGIGKIIKKQDKDGGNMTDIISDIISCHKKEIAEILNLIDDTPINGINLLPRFVNLISEIFADPDLRDFFGISEDDMMQVMSIGSAMESIKAKEN